MIRKNILAIALLGVFGLSHAADVENLRTLSYLNEPLRLQADVVGEGDIILAAPTEYLRLNHPIPSYDLSIDVVEQNGQKQVVLTTTEEIESPALTLLLESRDKDNRRQLFELPIILDFKPEPTAEPVVEEGADPEIVIDGVSVDAPVATTATDTVALAEVPTVAKEDTKNKSQATEKSVTTAVKPEPEEVKPKAEVAKVDKKENKTPAKAPAKPLPKSNNTNPELLKRYPVEKGETLWSIANKVRPDNVTPQKMIQIIKANNPSAFTASGVLRADVTLLIPTETPKVKHNFVASSEADAASDARIGYIYELPEPPVQQVTEPVKAVEPDVIILDNNEEVAVKVVRPVSEGADVVAPEVTTIVPQTNQPMDSVEINEPVEPTPEVEPAVVAPVVEPRAEEVTAPVEPPKRRPVYIMPEPEPEPGIVELIFENIVYIGAGALVLILGLLAVVMRRRKGDDIKQPKEKKTKVAKISQATPDTKQTEQPKKKGISLFGKKKDATATAKNEKTEKVSKGLFGFGKKKVDVAPVESEDVSKASVAPVATAIATAAVATAAAEPKDNPTLDNLDFDLSFTDDIAPTLVAIEEKQEESLDLDLSALDFGTAALESETPKTEAPEALDFDLPALDLGTTSVEVETPKVEESMDGLDFQLPSSDLASTDTVPVEDTKTEEYSGLDFDLSAFSSPVVEASESKEESFDMGGALDFDLGDFKIEQTPVIEADAKDDSFGENNPLFAPQESATSPIEGTVEQEPSDSIEPEEYISFTDLLENAEDTLVKDDIEAEKPADFGNFLEDEEAGLANLMEISKQSEVEPKLDLDFVADAGEDAASLAFLNSLETTDEIMLDEPINSSVKDNVAHATASMDILDPISIDLDALDLPVLDADVSGEAVESVMEEIEMPAISLAEPVIEEPVLEEIAIPEITIAEPVIEESVLEEITIPEVTIAEPVIEEPVLEEITIPEVTIAEPVIAEPVLEEITIPEVTIAEPVIEEVVVSEPIIELAVQSTTTAEASDTEQDADFESEQVKLELAVAYMDFDKSLAKPLLDEVVKDGNPSQVARAQALLAQIN